MRIHRDDPRRWGLQLALALACVGIGACSGGSGTSEGGETTTGSGTTTITMQETGTSGTTEAPMVTEGGGSMTAGETSGTSEASGTTTGGGSICGDGIVDPEEECDDGRGNGPGQACKADCTANFCGDGDKGPGEECDAGRNNKDDGLCKSDCTAASCGDGIVQPGEGCDDGNQIDDDECTNDCKLASCGDGIVDPGEECDDGNQDNSDGCTDKCLLPLCGDGYVQAGEECDEGPGNDDNDDCTTLCTEASCGDGLVHNAGSGQEECDDGNQVDDDLCSNLCVLATCDDGIKNAGESDVDCGGESCDVCSMGQVCVGDQDCETMLCVEGICAWPVSCADLLMRMPGLDSGVYTIDSDGEGPEPPFDVVCDMETEGGGWTLIANLHSNRIPQSIYRNDRFFTAAWRQLLDGHEVTSNAGLTLGEEVFGMHDASALIAAATDIRYSCDDQTRSLAADAIWTPTPAERTELLDSLIYSVEAKPVQIATNGGPYGDAQVYPTAANEHTYGCWHICGSCGPAKQTRSFQLGLCHNAPNQGDNNLSGTNHVAIGYHDGFQALRLECTADTPSNTPILNGTWRAWVR